MNSIADYALSLFFFGFALMWAGGVSSVYLARRSKNPAHEQLASLPYVPANMIGDLVKSLRAQVKSLGQRDAVAVAAAVSIGGWLICFSSILLFLI